jgi:putative Mn2+ efflux pump MntP
MALLFSFSLAMDKFVVGRVVTAIDYPSIQFSIRLAVATVVALLAKLPCSHAAKGVLSASTRAPH